MRKILFFSITASIIVACNTSAEGEKSNETSAPTEKSQQLLRAEEIHEQAMAVYMSTKEKVGKIRAEYDEEMANLDEGTPQDEMILKERYGTLIKRWETELSQWIDGLVEIPGHAHTHDHGDGDHQHDHNHEQDRILEGLSDSDHLNIQNEQLNVIKALEARVDDAIANKGK